VINYDVQSLNILEKHGFESFFLHFATTSKDIIEDIRISYWLLVEENSNCDAEEQTLIQHLGRKRKLKI
jgi:hypothetical protein